MSLWKTGKDRKKEKAHIRKKEKEHTRKKRDGIRTTELNRRDQVTAAKSWPSFHRKTGAKVDYQVAAPTELGTPTMHRAKIAQPRVRMEGRYESRVFFFFCFLFPSSGFLAFEPGRLCRHPEKRQLPRRRT